MSLAAAPATPPAVRLRRARPDDLRPLAEADARAFGDTLDEDRLADTSAVVDLDRFVLAVQGEGEPARIVGATGDFPFDLTVPGGGRLAVPGVTWVHVALDQRRRGVLRSLMAEQLRVLAEAGHAVALLTASEGGIYERFGYGRASERVHLEVDRRSARLREGVGTEGSVRFLEAREVGEHAADVHQRWCARTPGALSRSGAWWRVLLADRPGERHGGSALFHLGHPDGWVSYRVVDIADARGERDRQVQVVDRFAATDAAEAALWRALLSLDLMTTVVDRAAAPDDVLPHLLTDARQVRTRGLRDGVWVRPLDVAAALSARRYAVEVDVVLEVVDAFADLGGRFHLRGGPDGARCERLAASDRSPDVVLDAAALGSVWLGGHRLAALARAGRARVDDPSVLARADAALTAERAPRYGTEF